MSILSSKGTADAIRFVDSGLAEFGFVDIPSLVASGSASLRIVAGVYRRRSVNSALSDCSSVAYLGIADFRSGSMD